MPQPLAYDLCAGLGGWTEGLLATGWRVIGYDIEAHEYDGERYPAELRLADVLSLNGADLADADLIVASPPCQEFSYMAMPWTRAKQIARALRGEDEFPEGYRGSRTIAELNAIFDACFRIQREASEAAGHHIPMVVENVKGAQPWVGKAAWNFGSYFLWGDVPALMPATISGSKNGHVGGGSWFAIGSPGQTAVGGNPDGRKNPGFRFDGSGRSFQSESVERHVAPKEGFKSRGMDWSNRAIRGQDFTAIAGAQASASEGVKNRDADGYGRSFQSESVERHVEGVKGGGAWFNDYKNRAGTPAERLSCTSSKSSARKAASARIAKIPFTLSSWIGRCWLPATEEAA